MHNPDTIPLAERIDQIQSRLQALGAMVSECLFHDAGSLGVHYAGIFHLFNDQAEALEPIEQELRERDLAGDEQTKWRMMEGAKMRDEFILAKAKEGADVTAIAAAVNEKRERIEKLIADMMGVKAKPAPRRQAGNE